MMNQIRTINLFTLVMFFLTSMLFVSKVNAASKYSTCMANCKKDYDAALAKITNGQDTVALEKAKSERDTCQANCTNMRDDENEAKNDQKSFDASCDARYKEYQEQGKKTAEECNRMGSNSVRSCIDAANRCGGLLGGSMGGGGSEEVMQSINNLIGAYQAMNGVSGQQGAGAGCFIEDNEAEANRQERLDQQITSLKEQNEDSITKKSELDEQLADKEKDVKEKIQEAEADVNKKKIERQTKIQQEESRIQKAILNSQKKQAENLSRINKINIEIANIQFAQQQITIEFSDARVSKTCRDKVMAAKAILTAPTPGTNGGKPTAKKFTIKESQKIKADLKLEEQTCLQTEALKKSAQVKAIVDKRVDLQSQIDTLNKANADEAKAIEIEKKAVEAMKATASQEEKNDIDEKFSKMNTLSVSLKKFEDSVVAKKKSLDAKIAARKEQIEKIILAKQNVKKKYSTVSSSLSARQETSDAYLNQCCKSPKSSSGTTLKKHAQCGLVSRNSPNYTPVGGEDDTTN